MSYPVFKPKLLALSVALMAANLAKAEDASSLKPITVSGSTIEDRFEAEKNDPASSTVIQGEAVEAKHSTNIWMGLQRLFKFFETSFPIFALKPRQKNGLLNALFEVSNHQAWLF